MEAIRNPDKRQWESLAQRPVSYQAELEEKVMAILQEVKANGDTALKAFTKQFDGLETEDFRVNIPDVSLTPELEKAIQRAAENIRIFHKAQLQQPQRIETMPGVNCWRQQVGIEKVGLYIPGGSAPLFSTLLMLAIPAQLAG